ncbi:ATP synthase epsilon chain [hydrothermal vent metagenome]|uniref:ATP synthase epsilon chain n=1 Tax=hydrothermal vent metagenome TaxID=652676 RepID=A0A3B0XAK5_9ZZZZ
MAMTTHVDIVSAEREVWSGKATMVFAPGVMGELGIAPRHTPLLTMLKAGEVRVRGENGEDESYFISGGMLEVQPHVVTILSDTAVRADDLDEAEAIEAKKRAEDAMQDKNSEMDYARASALLAEAAAMVETIKKVRGRR